MPPCPSVRSMRKPPNTDPSASAPGAPPLVVPSTDIPRSSIAAALVGAAPLGSSHDPSDEQRRAEGDAAADQGPLPRRRRDRPDHPRGERDPRRGDRLLGADRARGRQGGAPPVTGW